MINKKYLPSKKFSIALSIAIAVILIAIIFNYSKPSVTKYLNNNLTADTNGVPIVANIDLDSDNDGLVDWKENLYGTDPKIADTDKDGTNDAEEVAQNRDPLKANTAITGQEPNDKIDPTIIEENQKKLEEYEKLNELDKFSRDLVSNIIATQPANGSIDQNATDLIINKALNGMPEKNYSGITKSADLNLLKTDSSNLDKNMSAYRNNFYTETQKLVPILGSDMIIISSLISGSSTNANSEMLKLVDKYQEVVNGLIKMPVPVAVGYYDINYHLRVINGLEKLIAIDKDVVNSSENSLSIFSNLTIYQNTIDDLFTTLTTIDTILKIDR